MHILNTKTLQLELRFDNELGKYKNAILSHTWMVPQTEEVTFKEISDSKGHNKRGYENITNFCQKAAEEGFSYVWIDTCCIDKSSSAELSEAINSMFDWYQNAEKCYVYLADVSINGDDSRSPLEQMRQSRWFTRGWTLQELLAPAEAVFYDGDWQQLGTKSELIDVVQEITRIKDIPNYRQACTAQKSAWAANRQTTRVEDAAYSLLGIFGVNMPLLYGEGPRAFVRLQMQILQQSEDESIFVWVPREDGKDAGNLTGLLAPSIANFSRSHDISLYSFDTGRPAWTMTNQGFQFKAYAYPAVDFRTIGSHRGGIFAIPLNCGFEAEAFPLSIILQQVSPCCKGVLDTNNKFQRILLPPKSWLGAQPSHSEKEYFSEIVQSWIQEIMITRLEMVVPQESENYIQPFASRFTSRPLLFVRINTSSLAQHGFTTGLRPPFHERKAVSSLDAGLRDSLHRDIHWAGGIYAYQDRAQYVVLVILSNQYMTFAIEQDLKPFARVTISFRVHDAGWDCDQCKVSIGPCFALQTKSVPKPVPKLPVLPGRRSEFWDSRGFCLSATICNPRDWDCRKNHEVLIEATNLSEEQLESREKEKTSQSKKLSL